MYLTQTQFDILRSWAQQTPQVEKAYLFGSYAKGEAHRASDIDIAIKSQRGQLDVFSCQMGAAPNGPAWSDGQHPHAGKS